jgi:hypothetical protein
MLMTAAAVSALGWLVVTKLSGVAFASRSHCRRWRSRPHLRKGWPSRLVAMAAEAQYLFDSLHDGHFKILLIAAKIGHLAHTIFEGLQINHSVVALGIIITAEPGSDEPGLTDFVMHELVTVHFGNIDRQLGLSRPGGRNSKDDYQADAHAFPCHKDPPL